MVKISSYTTTRNCFNSDYPFNEVIDSLCEFSDEVVIVDSSDGSDGTWNSCIGKVRRNPKVKIRQFTDVNWSDQYHGVYDGLMKARARALCSGDILYQTDMDEILHPDSYAALRNMAENFPADQMILALPVVEYWGCENKVRIDVPPWKWRLSRNLPFITHGIPKEFRRYDAVGNMYSTQGTDGCDYIHTVTGERLPFANFMTKEIDDLRQRAVFDSSLVSTYQNWVNQTTQALPTVHHFSWYSLRRKVKAYQNFWTGFWSSLYGQGPLEINPMFGEVKPEDVTHELIEQTAKELSTIGGWVFHQPWDKKTMTNHIRIKQSYPPIMADWMARNHD
jgi:hypothetical protein